MTAKKEGFSRREFVGSLVGGSYCLAGSTSLLGFLSSCASLTPPSLFSPSLSNLPFRPIHFSAQDDLVLAQGFNSRVLISEGDSFGRGLTFGANNDYTAFLERGPQGASPSKKAIMWVNHEFPNPEFGRFEERSRANIDRERAQVGGSLLELRRTSKGWEVLKNSPLNRRLDGTTQIPLVSERPIAGRTVAEGTFANCAGGVTPWGTILTCEENYQHYYGERILGSQKAEGSQYHWEKYYQNPPEHYGWVVEVHPLSGKAKKLTSLGRFSHESATCVKNSDGTVSVYSGDDKAGEFVYKFISQKSNSLVQGELFVAQTSTGRWLSLQREKQPLLQKHFKDQTDVLIHCRRAGKLLGATPLDRPEDIEVHPTTGDVFICLSNNVARGNYHGSILKLSEKGGDHKALEFKSQNFLVGGEDFSCPDNLVFDPKGNLWMVSDMSGKGMHQFPYRKFKNNGLFYIPMRGSLAGRVFQVASAPRGAELTGLSFSSDGKSLFLCVQHPGELSWKAKRPVSHWPQGGENLPKSSLVEISGRALKALTT